MTNSREIFRTIQQVLASALGEVANQRFQDPSVERRDDVARPYFYIRPYVPVFTESGPVRRRTTIRLGFCDEIKIARAKAIKEQIMAGINSQKFLIQSQVPFSGVLDKYLSLAIPRLGPESQKTYARHIRLHIQPFFGQMRMSEMNRLAVAGWLAKKEEEGLSHNSLIDIRKVLSAIFSAARDWNLWDGENPCARQKVGGKRAEKNKALPSVDGLRRFLGEIHDTKILSAEGSRLIAVTAASTGLRIGEILGLTLNALDPKKETIAVSETFGRGFHKPTKSDASKRTRQAPGLIQQIQSFAAGKNPDEYIFARPDGSLPDDRDLQQHVFRPAAESAGIYTAGFGMHRFRHLNISWRQEAGASPFEAQKSAGHAQPSTTWMYTHTDDERERQHVRTILDRLLVKPSDVIT